MKEKLNTYSPKDGDRIQVKIYSIRSTLFVFMHGHIWDYVSATVRGVNWIDNMFLCQFDNGKTEWVSFKNCRGIECKYSTDNSKV